MKEVKINVGDRVAFIEFGRRVEGVVEAIRFSRSLGGRPYKIRVIDRGNRTRLLLKSLSRSALTKLSKNFRPRSFIVISEKGRKRGAISISIWEILDGRMHLLTTELHISAQSNRGIAHEAVKALVKIDELPSSCVTAQGYIDYREKNYQLVVIEGQGLTYVNIVE